MRFYACFINLLCTPNAILRRPCWPKDRYITMEGRCIKVIGGTDTSIPTEDLIEEDWELIIPNSSLAKAE